MEKPQYIDWIVEESGVVIKDNIPLKCYKSFLMRILERTRYLIS